MSGPNHNQADQRPLLRTCPQCGQSMRGRNAIHCAYWPKCKPSRTEVRS